MLKCFCSPAPRLVRRRRAEKEFLKVCTSPEAGERFFYLDSL
jgi:hypothetical protein